MVSIDFAKPGELKIEPSISSSRNDFNFLAGRWSIHNRKLKSRLAHSTEWIEFEATYEMRIVLSGLGNIENIITAADEKPYEGMGIRLFNPATRLWSIYWADNISGTLDKPVVGSFENTIGTFFCKNIFADREIIVQFQLDISNPDKPVWSQAFSPDQGKSWEWNWYMHFFRALSLEPRTWNFELRT